MPIEGEEVLDFNTIFYDKEKKMIVKRIEKKVETGGQSGNMIIDKTLVHGIEDRLPAIERTYYNSKKEDIPIKNMH